MAGDGVSCGDGDDTGRGACERASSSRAPSSNSRFSAVGVTGRPRAAADGGEDTFLPSVDDDDDDDDDDNDDDNDDDDGPMPIGATQSGTPVMPLSMLLLLVVNEEKALLSDLLWCTRTQRPEARRLGLLFIEEGKQGSWKCGEECKCECERQGHGGK